MPLSTMNWMVMWQLAATSEMVALETCSALLDIMLKSNIQALGAPVNYASIPGIISACASVIFIATFGTIIHRWRNTSIFKAKVLGLFSFIELLGVTFVIIANGYKLIYGEDEATSLLYRFEETDIQQINLTTFRTLENATSANSIFSESSGVAAVGQLSTPSHTIPSFASRSYSNSPLQNAKFPNQKSYTRSNQNSASITSDQNISRDFPEVIIIREDSEIVGEIPWDAYLVMAGYTLMYCGHNCSICFLKLFVLGCTPPDFHPSVLIKSIFLASLGGVLATGIACSELNITLTSGTNLDPNIVLCCILAGLSFILLIPGTFGTILTGLLWKPPRTTRNEEEPNTEGFGTDEKTPLWNWRSAKIITTSRLEDLNALHVSPTNLGRDTDTRDGYGSCNRGPAIPGNNNTCEHEAKGESKTGLLRRYKTLLLICILDFLLCNAFFVFKQYSASFLGNAVYQGDPSAPKSSREYSAYLEGTSVGSQGSLISYSACAVVNIFHEMILFKLGCKLEVFTVSVVYAAICIMLAVTLELWAFYLAAVWYGCFRSVAVILPFILANRNSAKIDGGMSRNIAITFVSIMLPLSNLVSTPTVGTLVEVTGTTATSMYYAGVLAFLGALEVLLVTI